MAVIRKSSTDAWSAGRVDIGKLDATTEADIEAYMIAEGEDPDAPFEGYETERVRHGAERSGEQVEAGVAAGTPTGHRRIA